jgi:hypothetical protein
MAMEAMDLAMEKDHQDLAYMPQHHLGMPYPL